MKILFYQPYSQIVVYIESIVEQFAKEGHQTYFVSHAEKGDTHSNLEKFGCKTFALPVGRNSFFQYYKDRVFSLTRFCKEHEIDIVYSHFQEANIISVLAQFFCKSTFVITRHHSDCAFIDNNWKEKWADRIINSFAKVYIATSPKVYKQIVEIEGANPQKVMLINYGYNFLNFQGVNRENVEKIKKEYPSKIRVVMAARFISEKRHFLLIDAFKELIEAGFDIKLLLLGRGPMEEEVADYIQLIKANDRIFVIGFRLNVMDYFAAADLVVHFSLSEASNSAMKEAALTDTVIAVCKDVGDFEEYIEYGKNGFLLDKQNPKSDFIEIIRRIDKGEYNLTEMGKQLHEDVIARFDIKNVIDQYRHINESIQKTRGVDY
jgi:glycosyltransferase involved in cell wall biosynthesis